MLESLGRLAATQPVFMIAGILVLLMMIVGLRLVLAKYFSRWGKPDWNRDPEEMKDLSPALKRARILMSLTAGVMISLFILGIATIFTGN